jgi:hypothetical protein
MEEKKGVNIFGRFFSNRELFWNGFAFLLIGVVYDVISIGVLLQSDWKENVDYAFENMERSSFVALLFFVISYLLFDRRFFGSDLQKIIKKHGYTRYFLMKFSLVIALIFVNLIFKSIALITLF